MLERLTEVQAVCDEKVMSLRRNVQSYVGSNINSSASIFMLNIDTQLGLVMMTLNQLSKKRLAALEQVTESIGSRSRRPRSRAGVQSDSSVKSETKSEEDYLEIIDKLTREMFDYSQEPPVRQKSLSNMSRSESEYERVMRELDDKLRTTNLLIKEAENKPVSRSPRTSKRVKNPSLEIDKLFDHPDKVEIPSRYQPELEEEDEASEEARAEKSLDIR